MSDDAHFCGSCGCRLGYLNLFGDISIWTCPDCLTGFCSSEHLAEHRELGTCPLHADGLVS